MYYSFNRKLFFKSNLMFISNNFPNTPIEILYKMTNGGIIYSFIMIVIQMKIPFYISYYVIQKSNYFLKISKADN